MVDVSSSLLALPRQSAAPRVGNKEPCWTLIELLFFAYREFVTDADEVLQSLQFGRAHHRVLHFVNRNPGMNVAELLEILGITKQSLGRVLKQLIDEGYVEQREGPQDRRHRLLFVTEKGEALAMQLAALQTQRLTRALGEAGANANETVGRFLAGMIDPARRDGILALIAEESRPGAMER